MKESKNILFISTAFFEYEKEIKATLIRLGYNVHFFDERISNTKLIKIIYRISPLIGAGLAAVHFYRILRIVRLISRLDYLFLIKGEATPKWFIQRIKRIFPNIKTIFYTWDSFNNNPHALNLIQFFDKKFSFDLTDCNKYELVHRPLFSSLKSNPPYFYNSNLAVSVLTIHSDRILVLERIITKLANYSIPTEYYAYSRIKQMDLIKKSLISNKTFKVQSKPLNKIELINLIEKAKFIIDINHPQQTGLTMRTFEALVNSKKLITTNQSIKKYKFYNPTNICVVDRHNIEIPEEFIHSEFQHYEESFLEKMTINGWLKEIFDDDRTYTWVR